jgi:putative OPT family oligopeptide transporter
MGEVIGVLIPAMTIAPTMQLLQNAYGIGSPVREGAQALKAPQGVMFEKLVGGIFGASRELPWNLVAYGAVVGMVAIALDRIFLEPRKTKFRLHAMPLAVGMYLPWTVTFTILLGGCAYRFVEWLSHRRRDAGEVRQAVIHRGLLFSSGLVAGEAIMGIVIAMLVLTRWEMPFLSRWMGDGLLVELLSLAALASVIGLLILVSLRRPPHRSPP